MQGNNRAKLHIFFLTTIFTTELLYFNLSKKAFSLDLNTKNGRNPKLQPSFMLYFVGTT